MADRGRIRCTLLSLIEDVYAASALLKRARLAERHTAILDSDQAEVRYLASKLKWHAEWLTKLLPYIDKYLPMDRLEKKL